MEKSSLVQSGLGRTAEGTVDLRCQASDGIDGVMWRTDQGIGDGAGEVAD